MFGSINLVYICSIVKKKKSRINELNTSKLVINIYEQSL